ncbi:DUF397 domain-containing protein [Kitasatospora viridis]|uniref:Uncharacterized protein DUF397 n=1 Tax=Kitasatospora viridis TaxID=281105 RepID=A0A561SEE0_9ACTN|nr:DUF397 domain-containing protein [Kitasatospora viridis]TWF73225.1 uncharacterized protein DUF397 [Kitasatospora viridis]
MSTTPGPRTSEALPKADLYALDVSGLERRTSSFSQNNSNCVEVAHLPGGGVVITDSKRPDRSDLRYDAAEWEAFKKGILAGEL